ncbi:carbohydrate ABC transporter membrane protein 2, CUT1 family [Streptomyces sp. Ag82_O1-12]|uniref:carbohydrate ABC transporter permease n=1 Tax=unclassified Streptomyces TaxID=2593676 RepID=UPI000BCFED99|nr:MULTISPECIES: carbohydrate ABC transporter permease [unclassified Streptomyces]SMQ20397.1 carbohydrate ABC transporter membrane protein 2, CUT1 family [Streptomyces sp. Ag82_O1-12]SOD49273.1 carbohydrate ABC transporter membrane protein 2, CUT1 family [Streptomyces sp. Ag82_G6-1]
MNRPLKRPASLLRVRSVWNTAAALLILAVLLFPVYWMLNTALQPESSIAATEWFPVPPSLKNFDTALSTQGGSLLTSLVVALGAVVVCLAFAAPAAYGLAQFGLRGGQSIVFATLITQMVPGIVIANALYSAYAQLDLVNSYLGLILADASLGLPFAVVLLRAFMVSIPSEVVEAAMVDGANRLTAFVRIVLPMSRNALITAGLFTFLFAWSDFMFALTLNTTDDVKPVTLGIYQFVGAHVSDWGAVMATAVLSAVPAAVLLVVAQKYIAAGITGGSVK